MFFLAAALVFIFVLYLIDKHSKWKAALIVCVVLFLLSVIGAGSVYAYYVHKEKIATQKREALAAKWEREQREAVKKEAEACPKDKFCASDFESKESTQ